MLLRYFSILLLINSFLFCAYEERLFEEYPTTLRSVNKDRATIDDSPLIAVGSSGIVTHEFQDTNELIIAKAIVLAKDGVSALIELKPYGNLAQDSFPKLAIIPKSGDKIRLNYLYDRALIISPTFEKYKKITNFFPNIEWIHPDIATAYLAKKYAPSPSREDFSEICKINLAGLVLFNIKNKGYFADCSSFKIVKSFTLFNTDDNATADLPFYSRISNTIQTSPLAISSKNIENYDSFYEQLLDLP